MDLPIGRAFTTRGAPPAPATPTDTTGAAEDTKPAAEAVAARNRPVAAAARLGPVRPRSNWPPPSRCPPARVAGNGAPLAVLPADKPAPRPKAAVLLSTPVAAGSMRRAAAPARLRQAMSPARQTPAVSRRARCSTARPGSSAPEPRQA